MTIVSTSGYIGAFVDVASSARTATFTSNNFLNDAGNSMSVDVIVTAVSGTSPTMDVVIQESMDGGTNWIDRYHFPRISATGVLRTPKIQRTGKPMRYVCTIAGTTPSFTFSVVRNVSNDVGTLVRQFIDRTIAVNTLNSTTASFDVGNCQHLQIVANRASGGTTAPTIIMQGSVDNGATWFDIGSGVTPPNPGSAAFVQANYNVSLVRARVSTAGSGAVLGANGILLKGF